MKAIVTHNIPEWKAARKVRREELAEKEKHKAQLAAFKSKNYADLSSKDKDELFRLMAIELGILRG